MKVGDWMIRGVAGIPPTTRVADALATLLRFHLNGIPVVDESRRLLGILTLSDVRRRVLPSQEELAEHEDYLSVPERMEERFIEVGRLPVKELMVAPVVTVTPDENVLKAGALMNARRVKQLPVVERGQVVGILSAADIAWGLLTKFRRHA